MSHPQLKPPEIFTLTDFLAMSWPDDARRELHEGQIVAQAAPTRAHATIVRNLAVALHRVLPRGCDVLTDIGVAPVGREHTYYEVDLLVTCEPPEARQYIMRAPTLLVEVLSRSTQAVDRNRKVPDYRRIPSVREILLIDSEHMAVELYRRFEGTRWASDILREPDEVLYLESAGLDITLADLYDRVVFPDAA